MKKPQLVILFATLLLIPSSGFTQLKVFENGEVANAADINANFNYLDNKPSGGSDGGEVKPYQLSWSRQSASQPNASFTMAGEPFVIAAVPFREFGEDSLWYVQFPTNTKYGTGVQLNVQHVGPEGLSEACKTWYPRILVAGFEACYELTIYHSVSGGTNKAEVFRSVAVTGVYILVLETLLEVAINFYGSPPYKYEFVPDILPSGQTDVDWRDDIPAVEIEKDDTYISYLDDLIDYIWISAVE